MQALKDKIIEILVKNGHINDQQLKKALELQKDAGIPLRKVLINEGIIRENLDILAL